MGLLNWVMNRAEHQNARPSDSPKSQILCFEQLEPRVLLSADVLKPVELSLCETPCETAIVVDLENDEAVSSQPSAFSEDQSDGGPVGRLDSQTVGQSDGLTVGQSVAVQHNEYLASLAVASEDLTIHNSEFKIQNSSLDNVQTRGPPSSHHPLVTSHSNASVEEVIFIDEALNDDFQPENAFQPGVVVRVLDSSQNIISQITSVLSSYAELSAIHIISHGAPGQMIFGNLTLNTESLKTKRSDIDAWGLALTPNGDILLYGCSVGQGEIGHAFAQDLAAITRADVAASINPTGNIEFGGDWELEETTGSIEAEVPFFCTASASYSGTLGLVINEILADPASDLSGDANGDGTRHSAGDEFVEILNDSNTAVDISGWTLSDAVGVRHTFYAGTGIEAHGVIVVFGGGTPTGAFGGAVVHTASSGQLGLNNGGDTVILNNGTAEQAMMTYGSQGGDDQSLTRDPDITGLLIKHSLATGSGGTLFSPGTRIDGTPFMSNSPPTDVSLSHSSVSENEPIGMEVGMLSTTDSNADDIPTYSLVLGAGDDDNESFTIDGIQLKTAGVFDYETKNSYSIRVRTDDGHGGRYEEQFMITVTDGANLSLATMDTDKSEGNTGETVFTFTVTRSGDTSGMTTVNWSVTGCSDYPADASDFSGTLPSGTVTFNAGDTQQGITVNISGDRGTEHDEGFTVTLSNASDLAEIPSASADGTILNDDTAGITVSPINGLVTTEAGGTATFTVVLDSEPTSDVSIVVISTDTTEGTVSTSALVFTASNWSTAQTVKVTGVDDDVVDGDIAYTVVTEVATSTDTNYSGLNATHVSVTNEDNDVGLIITSSDTVSIAENQTAVIDVQSTDLNGDTEGSGLVYRLTRGADLALFGIDTNIGVIMFNVAPDYENSADAGANNVYDVQVTVTDSGGLTDIQDLTVTVTDVNESPTDIALSGNTVTENIDTTSGYVVGALTGMDPDTGAPFNALIFSIQGGADNGKFSVDGANNLVLTDGVLDFEIPADANTDGVYEVTVRVTDGGGLTYDESFNMTVTGQNEAPTVALANTMTSLAENTDTTSRIKVADIVVTDDALGTNILSLSGNDAAEFEIDGTALYLKAGSVLDYEIKSQLDVTVEADDASLGATSDDTADLSIEISDVNEPPTINLIGNRTINEGVKLTFTAIATDPDVPTNMLTYSLSGLIPLGATIDQNSGVFTWTPADNGIFSFKIVVTDNGIGHLSDSEMVTVGVNNVAPLFDGGPDAMLLPSDAGVFGRTGIPFSDPGTLDTWTGTVNYGDGTGDFSLNINSGTMTFDLSHTFMVTDTYTVTVTIQDDDAGSYTDAFDVTVILGTTEVSLDGLGNMTITDVLGGDTDDTLTIQSDDANSQFIISDPNSLLTTDITGATGIGTHVVYVPFNAVNGTEILVHTMGGNDTLTIDCSLGDFKKSIIYDGGEPTSGTGDTLLLAGDCTVIEFTAFNTSSGTIQMSHNALISYTGLEPIVSTVSAAHIVLDYSSDTEVITVMAADPGHTTVTSTAAESFTFMNPTSSLTINAGDGADTINVEGVGIGFDADLTINGQGGVDTIDIDANLTLGVDKNVVFKSDIIQMAGATVITTKGIGSVTLDADQLIDFNTGASVQVVDGDITLLANQAGVVAGDLGNIDLSGTLLVSTGTGSIVINAWAGDRSTDDAIAIGRSTFQVEEGDVRISGYAGFGTGSADGVDLGTDSVLEVTGSGAIVIEGISNTGNSADGVEVSDTIMSTVTGRISLTGHADQAGNSSDGVELDDSVLLTQSGPITINGSSVDAGSSADGVDINDTIVESVYGEIRVFGTATGAGSSADGVEIAGGAVIQTTDSGAITITGIGQLDGVYVTGTSTAISSINGPITLDGMGGGVSSAEGVHIAGSDVMLTSVTGDIKIIGHSGGDDDGVEIENGAIVSSTGTGLDAATITIVGTGGSGTTDYGIELHDAGTAITSLYGAIILTGSSPGGDGVYVGSGAMIASTGVGSDAATITIHGTGGGVSGSEGVVMTGVQTAVTSAGGAINITGHSGGEDDGIEIDNGATVASLGLGIQAATITMTGTGGSGSTDYGIELGGPGTNITSISGDICITGSSPGGDGVYMDSGVQISSVGHGVNAALITIEGTGGGTSSDEGIHISGTGTKVSSVDGAILIRGDSGGDDDGVEIDAGAEVSSTGTGAHAASMTIVGIGDSGATDYGIEIADAGTRITAVDGNIVLNGTSEVAQGVFIGDATLIVMTGTGGALFVTANDVAIEGMIQAESGWVHFLPSEVGLTFDLGDTSGTGDYVLTDAEFNRIFTLGHVVVGDSTTGMVSLTGLINPAGFGVLEIISGVAIGDTNTTGFDFTGTELILNGQIAPGHSPGILEVDGNVTLKDNSSLMVEIGGASPGTADGDHDQLAVSHGMVTIGSNVTLHIASWDNFIPAGGEQIVIIHNHGPNAILGAFVNFAEGTAMANFLGSGLEAVFSYQGGDGNDVVVTVNAPPMAQAGGPYRLAEGATITLDGSGSIDPNQSTLPLMYEWDLDNDGQYDDATGSQPTFSAVGLDGPASVSVGLKVTDHQGASDEDTATINVTNASLVVSLGAVVSVDENGIATLTGSIRDAGTLDTHTATIDWGDGTPLDTGSVAEKNGSGTVSGSHVYVDSGMYSMTVTVTDDDTASGSDSAMVVVDNVAPTGVLGNNGPVNGGATATVTFSNPFDPSPVDTSAGFRYAYDFDNDGAFEVGDGSYVGSVTHASQDVPTAYLSGPGVHSVHGRIFDKDGGYTDYTTDIAVLATIRVSLDNTNLKIEDVAGWADHMTLQEDQGNRRWIISDTKCFVSSDVPNNMVLSPNSVAIPYNEVSGDQILVRTMGGEDTLTIDCSLGDFTKSITYDGGEPATGTGDTLTLAGNCDVIEFTAFDAARGTILMSHNALITYSGLEPIISTVPAVDIVLNYSSASETITVIDAGAGQTTVTSTAAESFTFLNPTGSLTINAGGGDDEVDVHGLGVNYPAHVTIHGQEGLDTVELDGVVGLGMDKNLTVSAETIKAFSSCAINTNGSGSVILKADRNIDMNTGAVLETVNGDIRLTANAAGLVMGDFTGIDIYGALLTSTGNGRLVLTAWGGNTPSDDGIEIDYSTIRILNGAIQISGHAENGVSSADGLDVGSSSLIEATGTGFISLTGIAGLGSSSDGIEIDDSRISSHSGDIRIEGDSSLADSSADGVDINESTVYSASGTIEVTGVSTGAGSSADGVELAAGTRVHSDSGPVAITGIGQLDGVYITGDATEVSSISGAITLNGTGSGEPSAEGVHIAGSAARVTSAGDILIVGDSGGDDDGVEIENGAVVASTGHGAGAGSITIRGIGGRGTTDYGIEIDDTNTRILANAGDILISGTEAIRIGTGSQISSVGYDSNITIVANDLSLTGMINAGDGRVMILPARAGLTFGLGSTSGPWEFVITDAEFDQIFTTDRIVIGDTTTGAITFANTVSPAGAGTLELVSSVAIHDSHKTGYDFVGLQLVLNGPVAPGQSPGILSVSGDVTLAAKSTLDIEIGGDTPGTTDSHHDQLSVSQGVVTIETNVALHLSSWDNYIPTGGEQLVMIDNPGSHAIVGTFSNFDEGTALSNFLGSGLEAVLSYQGGDGNNAVIIVNIRPMAEAGGPYSVAEGAVITLDGSGSRDPDQSTMPLTYEWDLDNDGQYDDATGVQPTFSAVGLDGPTSVTVGLKVTDRQGASDTDTATVNLTNVDPVMDSVVVTTIDASGQVTLSGAYRDAGLPDTHVLTVDWDDGDIQNVSVLNGSFEIRHQYDVDSEVDRFVIGVTLTDDDTGRDVAGVATGHDPEDVHSVPVVTVSGIFVQEGSSGDYVQKASFEVVLSEVSEDLVKVGYKSLDLTAKCTLDHWAMRKGELYFYPGTTRVVVSITIYEDLVPESNETFALNLTGAENAVLETAQAICTIVDDDSVVTTPVIKGVTDDTGAHDGSTSDSTVLIYGSAPGSDEVEVFLNNVSIGLATVKRNNWTLDYRSVTLSDGTYLIIAQAIDDQGQRSVFSETYTLTIDQSRLSITLDDVTVTEGNGGRVYADFMVHLSQASNQIVEVCYTSSNGTATRRGDYHEVSGTLWFYPGQTSVKLPVNVFGDTLPEINEQFTVTLTSTNLGQIVDSTAVCTILDDDIQDPQPIEQFTGAQGDTLDLDHSSVTFTPDAEGTTYMVTAEPISSLPTDPAGGTPVPAGNDVSTHVELSDGRTVRLYNVIYSDLYINTNGSVSFDQPVVDPTETLQNHNAVPQVSALFADLDTGFFGQISYRNLTDRVAITWSSVPAYGSTGNTGANTFQIELFHSGQIRLSWLDITQSHAIVGLSKGIYSSLFSRQMDLSSYQV